MIKLTHYDGRTIMLRPDRIILVSHPDPEVLDALAGEVPAINTSRSFIEIDGKDGPIGVRETIEEIARWL